MPFAAPDGVPQSSESSTPGKEGGVRVASNVVVALGELRVEMGVLWSDYWVSWSPTCRYHHFYG